MSRKIQSSSSHASPSLNQSFPEEHALKPGILSNRASSKIEHVVKALSAANSPDSVNTDSTSNLVIKSHQLSARMAIAENLQRGKTCGYIKHACSTGKTFIAGDFIDKSGLQAIVAVFSNDAITHFTNEFRTFFPTLTVGPIGSSAQVALVTHAKLLSLWKNNEIPLNLGDAVVIDEAHLMLGPKRRAMVESLKGDFIILGLTATDTYFSNKRLFHLMGESWHTVSIDEAIREKLIAPFKVELVRTHADISQVQVKAGDYTPTQLAKAFDLQETIRGGVKIYQERFLGQSLLVHCGTLSTATKWAEEFNRAGIPAKILSGSQTKDERKNIVAEVEQGIVPVLCGCQLVATSLNIPRFSVLYNGTPTLSRLAAEQRFNRVTRLSPTDPDKVATILEFLPKKESLVRRAILVPDLLGGKIHFGSVHSENKKSSGRPSISDEKVPLPIGGEQIQLIIDSTSIFEFLEERERTTEFGLDLSKLRTTESELRHYSKAFSQLHDQALSLLRALRESVTSLIKHGQVNQDDRDANLLAGLIGNTSAIKREESDRNTRESAYYTASDVGNVLHPKFLNAMSQLYDRFLYACEKQQISPPESPEDRISLGTERDVEELVELFENLGALYFRLKREVFRSWKPLYEDVAEKLITSKKVSPHVALGEVRTCLNNALYDIPVRLPHTVSRFVAKKLERLVADWQTPPSVKQPNAQSFIYPSFYERRLFEENRAKQPGIDTSFIELEQFGIKSEPKSSTDKIYRTLIEEAIGDQEFDFKHFRGHIIAEDPSNGASSLQEALEKLESKLSYERVRSTEPEWIVELADVLSPEVHQALSWLLRFDASALLSGKPCPWTKELEREIAQKITQLPPRSGDFLKDVFKNDTFYPARLLKHRTELDVRERACALRDLALSFVKEES